MWKSEGFEFEGKVIVEKLERRGLMD